MKSALLFLLVVLTGFCSSAQTTYFESRVGWRKSGLELHTFSDLNQTLHCSVLADEDSMRVFFFQGDSLRWEKNLPRIAGQTVKGGFFRNDSIHLSLESSTPKGYHWWYLPVDGSPVSETFIDFDPPKQKILDQYSAGDRFLIFTTEKKDHSFHIWSFSDKEDPDTMSCTFPDRTWYFLTKSNGFGRTLNIAKMDFFGEATPEIASRPNKIYYRKDSLFLVMDADGRTLIYRFDMLHHNLSKSKIVHYAEGSDVKENSFLLDNRLYYVNVSEDSLMIEINDFSNGNLLRAFTTAKKDTIRFRNTVIRQEGLDMLYGAGGKNLDRTAQLMRKMRSGEPFINAVPQPGGYVALAIGSYKEVQRTSGGGGFYGPAISPGGAPTYVSSGFYRSSYSKTTHYGMQLDSNGLDFLEGEMKPAINQQIETYTDGIKISETCENLFHNDNGYRYAYYDNKERKLVMVRF